MVNRSSFPAATRVRPLSPALALPYSLDPASALLRGHMDQLFPGVVVRQRLPHLMEGGLPVS